MIQIILWLNNIISNILRDSCWIKVLYFAIENSATEFVFKASKRCFLGGIIGICNGGGPKLFISLNIHRGCGQLNVTRYICRWAEASFGTLLMYLMYPTLSLDIAFWYHTLKRCIRIGTSSQDSISKSLGFNHSSAIRYT